MGTNFFSKVLFGFYFRKKFGSNRNKSDFIRSENNFEILNLKVEFMIFVGKSFDFQNSI